MFHIWKIFFCFESVHTAAQRTLLKWPARSNYTEVKSITFVIPTGKNQFIREDIFNSEPIRRVVLGLCPNTIFSGVWNSNPLQFDKHNLRMVRLIRTGVPIVEYNTQDNTQVYYNAIQSLHLTGMDLKLLWETVKNTLVWYLT